MKRILTLTLLLGWTAWGADPVRMVPTTTVSRPFLTNETVAGMRAHIGAIRKVDSVADLKALTGADVTNMVYVLGYYTPGDMGGGLYFWNSSDTTTTNSGSAFYQSGSTAAGRWLLKHNGTVSVCQWGAKVDNSQDDQPQIQNLFNTVAVDATRTIKVIEWPFGTCKLNGSPLILAHWNTTGQAVTSITRASTTATVTTSGSHGLSTGAYVVIAGATQTDYNLNTIITVTGANTFTYTVANSPATPATGTIVCQTVFDDITGLTLRGMGVRTANTAASIISQTSANMPALILERCKGVSVEGLAFLGKNVIGATLATLPIDTTFRNGTALCSTNAFSPHAAIIIDPFDGSILANGNSYSGLNSFYTGSATGGSSRCSFAGCSFRYWDAGIVIGASAFGLQDEEMMIRECEFTDCRNATGFGHSQIRGAKLIDCHFEGLRLVIDARSYNSNSSTHTGATAEIRGGDWVVCQGLVLGNDNWSGFSCTGLYGEQNLGIGQCSRANTVVNKPINFTDCEFTFMNTINSGMNYHFANIGGLAKFKGCTLETSGDLPFMVYVKNNSDADNGIDFDTCDFVNQSATWVDPFVPFGVFANEFNNITFNNCKMNGVRVLGNRKSLTRAWSTVSRNWAPPGSQFAVNGVAYQVVTPTTDFTFGTTNQTFAVNAGDGRAAATFGSILANYAKPNDVIFQTAADTAHTSDTPTGFVNWWLGIISSVDTASSTGLVRGVNYSMAGSGSSQFGGFSIRRMPRVHAPTYGDVLNANATISNVSPNPTLNWAVGDAITGESIRPGSWVSNLTATTITLNAASAATASRNKSDLYDALYVPLNSDQKRYSRQNGSLTLKTTDGLVAITQDTRTVTFGFLASAVEPGHQLWIVDGTGTLSSVGPITVTPSGADTINGVAGNYSFIADRGTIILTSDGVSNWHLAKMAGHWNSSGTADSLLTGTAKPDALVVTNGITDQSLSASQRVLSNGSKRLVSAPLQPTVATLADGATITWTCDATQTCQLAQVTLGGNRTLAFASTVAGMDGYLRVVQDGTGSRGLTLPGSSKVVGGAGSATIALTATPGAIDILCWYYDGTTYYWTLQKNF